MSKITGDIEVMRAWNGKDVLVQHGEGFNAGPVWFEKEPAKLLVTPSGALSYEGFGGYAYKHYAGHGVWQRYEGSEHLLRVWQPPAEEQLEPSPQTRVTIELTFEGTVREAQLFQSGLKRLVNETPGAVIIRGVLEEQPEDQPPTDTKNKRRRVLREDDSPESWIGRTFNKPTVKTQKERLFKVVRIERKNHKYPIIVSRVPDGAMFKMSETQVKKALFN